MAARVEATEALSQDIAFAVLEQSLRRMQQQHEQRTEERMAMLEERLERLEERSEAVGRLEERMMPLEVAMKATMEVLLPWVEAVLRKLDGSSPNDSNPLPSALPPVAAASSSSSTATTPVPPMTPGKRRALGEALFKAAEKGRTEDVKRLLQDGADVHYRKEDWCNRTPLHVAAQGGHADVMALLITAGAYINIQEDFQVTPLHVAAYCGKVAAVRALVDAGANVNCQAPLTWTPLQLATRQGDEEMVRVLINAGAR